MDVKQAIGFILEKALKRDYEYFRDGEKLLEAEKILQDLERYREMWEEVHNRFHAYCFNRSLDVMEIIEQKYFYQPMKKVIRIEVEAKDKKTLNGFEKFLKQVDRQYGEHGDIKVNIKEE